MHKPTRKSSKLLNQTANNSITINNSKTIIICSCARWKQFSILRDWQTGPSLVHVHIVHGEIRLASPISSGTHYKLCSKNHQNNIYKRELQLLLLKSSIFQRIKRGIQYTNPKSETVQIMFYWVQIKFYWVYLCVDLNWK